MAGNRKPRIEKPADRDAASPGNDIIGLAGIEIVNPAGTDSDAGTGNGDGEPTDTGNAPRKRGRKPGSTNKPRTEKASASSVIGIEKLLFSIHAIAAAGLKTPELELDDSEAKLLAQAATSVADHYNVTVDPKIVAWVGLIGVAGSIYGPRLATIKMRKDMEQRNKQQPQQNQAPKKNETNISFISDPAFVAPV